MSNKRLNATIVIGGTITGALKGALGSSADGLKRISSEMQALNKRQVLLGKSIQTFGRMNKDVSGLRESYARTVEQVDRLRRAQERLNQTQKQYKGIKAAGGMIQGAAARAGMAGVAIGGVLYTGVKSSIDRENAVNVIRNSGVSKQEADAMVNAARNSRQFGVSITKATDTVGELRTALGDAHHAIEALPTTLKALSGLQLYNRGHKSQIGEDAAYSLAKIAEERGGASSPEALREKQNWAFKALTGSNGVVSAEDQLTAIRRGKSAIAAMSDRAFFGDTFLMQAMSANGYGTASSTLVNAWIGGHQGNSQFEHMREMGLLREFGPKGKRLFGRDKNGNVNKVSPEALIDNQLFLKDPQAWVDKYLIPIAQKNGVDLSDPASIAKFANSIASNTNAANIVTQRIRFSKNIAKDRHNVDIANGLDESDAANRKSTQGKMDNARARLDDARTRVGDVLLPAFASAMEKTASALESVNKFADEHPRLFKAIAGGLGATAAALVVVTPLLFAANGVLQTIATIRLARAAAEVAQVTGALNGVQGAAAGAASGVLGFVGKLGVAAGLAGVALAAAKAAGLPDVDDAQGAKDVKAGSWLAASAHLPAGAFIRAYAAHWAGRSNDDIAASLGAGQNPADPQPKVPPMATAKSSAAPTQDNRQYRIEFYQQPGQSGKDAATELMTRLGTPQRAAMGSGLYDTGM